MKISKCLLGFTFSLGFFFAALAAAQDLQKRVTYICNGERIFIENCNMQDTSDTSTCMVAHPDTVLSNGLMKYTYETRGSLKKLFPTCKQPSADEVAHAKVHEKRQNDVYEANARKAGMQPGSATPKPATSSGTPPHQTQPESSGTETAYDFAQRAIRYDNAKDYPKAIEAYKKALALNPNLPEAPALYAAIGVTYYKSQQYDKAVASLRESLRRNPDSNDTWAVLGMSLYELKQYPSALEALQKAVTLSPRDDRNQYWLGRTYFEMNQLDKAMDAFQITVQLKPNDDDLLYWVGRTYWNLHRSDKAIASLKESVRLNPQNSGSWSFLGLAYFSSAHWPEAVEASKQAIRLNPNANDYDVLGMCYLYMGKRAEAQQVYEKLLTMDKDIAQEFYGEMSKRHDQ